MSLNYSDPGWTDERVTILKQLWSDGLSASQIAAELGYIKRNAVIGKVHRLGLSRRAKSPSSAAPRPRKQRSAGQPMRVQRPQLGGNTGLAYDYEFETDPVEAPEIIIPFAQRKLLTQLTSNSCRWPVGDPSGPDFFFCGGDAAEGRSYCSFHCCLAYQPPSDRRRAGKWARRGTSGGTFA
ncbi:MAG: GcrA cell cycle regulator [Rhodopseudomonas sp.]|nr:GcrA cell cycle regulator [Rhodopseudomonas sp.]